MNCSFSIGPIGLTIARAAWTPATIPANFRPFAAENPRPGAVLTIKEPDEAPTIPATKPLSGSFNDLGRADLYDGDSQSWLVALTPRQGQKPRVMLLAKDYCTATLFIGQNDPYYNFTVNSMARILFSQHAAARGALMVHASAVVEQGSAYVFMGPSGTGKSTHSRLWLQAFPGSKLLNDDCPLVAPGADGSFEVCGTPWSGKTPCYINASAPLAGMARLKQAADNRFTPLAGVEAFVAFAPSMAALTADAALYAAASATALQLLDKTPFGRLDCLPTPAAARLLNHTLAPTPLPT